MHVRNRPQDYEICSNFCSSVSACEVIAREFSFRIVCGRLGIEVQDRVMMSKWMRDESFERRVTLWMLWQRDEGRGYHVEASPTTQGR